MLSIRQHPILHDGLALVDAVRDGDHEEARFLSGRVLVQAEEAGLQGLANAVLALAPCIQVAPAKTAPTTLASLSLLGELLDVQYGFSAAH